MSPVPEPDVVSRQSCVTNSEGELGLGSLRLKMVTLTLGSHPGWGMTSRKQGPIPESLEGRRQPWVTQATSRFSGGHMILLRRLPGLQQLVLHVVDLVELKSHAVREACCR